MYHDLPVGTQHINASFSLGSTRLEFRDPPRNLGSDDIICLGSTETFGKFVATPFAAHLAAQTGRACLNLGLPMASVDAFLHDSGAMNMAQQAGHRIVQIMGAHGLSNRFYAVHPRRNDRFLRASLQLTTLYPEVDFSEICFVKHLLSRLWETSPERFCILRQELQQAWAGRMASFLRRIGPETHLLWFAPQPPTDTPWEERCAPLRAEPAFVTKAMLDALRPLVTGVVEVSTAVDGIAFIGQQPDATAHLRAAQALAGVL